MRERATVIVCLMVGVLLAGGMVWSQEGETLESRFAPRSSAAASSTWAGLTVRSFAPEPAGFRSQERQARRGAGQLAVLSRSLTGTVHGLVVSVVSHGSWVNTYPEPRDGREVTETVITPAVAALHSFWITENGRRIEAELRTKTQARAAYESIVRRRRDPGLLEWVAEGAVSFSLYPVLADGTPKEAAWSMDAVVDVDEEGWRRLPLPVGNLVNRELTLDLVVDEPGGVAEWRLPEGASARPEDGGAFRITGRWRDVVPSTSTLVVAWRANRPEPLPSSAPSATFDVRRAGDGWMGTVAVPVGDSWLPLTLLGEGAVEGSAGRVGSMELQPRFTDAPPLQVSEAAWGRVVAAARIADSWEKSGAAEGVAGLAARERLVSPVSSLFARPDGGGDATVEELAAESTALRGASAPGPAVSSPQRRSLFGDGESTFGTFRRSRERAYGRACMANVRTIAGALEMYLLDENLSLEELVERFAVRQGGDGPPLFEAASESVIPVYRRSSLGAGGGSWTDLGRIGPLLVAGGYLQTNPEDPGMGRGSEAHYVVTARDLVFCRAHGVHSLHEHQNRSARQVLQEKGETDPALLALAPDVQSLSATRGRQPLFPFVAEPILILIVAVFLARLGRWYPGTRSLALVFLGFFVTSIAACLAWGPLRSFEATFATARLVWLVGGSLLASVLALFLPWRAPDDTGLVSKEVVTALADEEARLRGTARWTVKVGGGLTLLLVLVGMVANHRPEEPLMLTAMAVVAALLVGAVSGFFRFAGFLRQLAEGRDPGLSGALSVLVHGVVLVLLIMAILPLAVVGFFYAGARAATAAAMAGAVRRSCGG